MAVGERREAASLLQGEIAAMNVENFVVRTKRRLVEKYAKPEAWMRLNVEEYSELAHEVAGLPSELEAEDEEAKRFDLLMFSLELALLKGSKRFSKLKKELLEMASALETQTGIPAIAQPITVALQSRRQRSVMREFNQERPKRTDSATMANTTATTMDKPNISGS